MGATAKPDKVVSFVGVLTRRHYRPGHQFVQLVFETSDGVKLSLSRDLRLVRSLVVGTNYQIKGRLQTMGNKQFVTEPTAIEVPYALKKSRKRRLVLFALAAVFLVGLGIIGLRTTGNSKVQLQATTTAHQSTLSFGTTSAPTTTTTNDTATVPTTSPTPATTTTNTASSATKPKTTSAAPAASQASTTVTVPVVSTPDLPVQPDCDTAVSYQAQPTTIITTDNSLIGTVVAGTDGLKQTCYPDGRTTAGVTTIRTPAVAEITYTASPS